MLQSLLGFLKAVPGIFGTGLKALPGLGAILATIQQLVELYIEWKKKQIENQIILRYQQRAEVRTKYLALLEKAQTNEERIKYIKILSIIDSSNPDWAVELAKLLTPDAPSSQPTAEPAGNKA